MPQASVSTAPKWHRPGHNPSAAASLLNNTSEDCLLLDVVRVPANPMSSSLPVMVNLHERRLCPGRRICFHWGRYYLPGER